MLTTYLCRAAGLQLAARDGVEWILHVDTDELIYPGGAQDYSLQHLLAAQPPDVDNLVFPNWESMPERDDVSMPFTQVQTAPWHDTGICSIVLHRYGQLFCGRLELQGARHNP